MNFNDSAMSDSHAALNITKRCNQRCVFCFEGERQSWQEPSLEQIRRLVDKIDARCKEVVLMGAEALLRPDINEVIKLIRARDFKLTIFTNGQPLARPGFISELAEAGLQSLMVSFHYADAESFERGTRTRANRFERLLEGLRCLRRHNERFPERQVFLNPETMLFRFNLGRLQEIVDLLKSCLGASFHNFSVSRILPTDAARRLDLIDTIRDRRQELASLLETWDKNRDIAFTRVPLCMIPGWEHHSLELQYRISSVYIEANFSHKGRLSPMYDICEEFRHNPFRKVCNRCTLLPLCSTNAAFEPLPEHRPFPSAQPIGPILNRLGIRFEDIREKVRATHRVLLKVP